LGKLNVDAHIYIDPQGENDNKNLSNGLVLKSVHREENVRD